METPASLLEMSRKFEDKRKDNEEEMRLITEQVDLLAQAHRAEMLEKERKARSHEELAGHLLQLMRKRKAENRKLANCQELLAAFQKNVASLGLDDQVEVLAPQDVGEPTDVLPCDLKLEDGQARQVSETNAAPVSIWTPLPCSRKEPMGFDECMAVSLPGTRKKQKSAREDVIVLSSDESGDENDGAVSDAKPLASQEPPQYYGWDTLTKAGPNTNGVSEVHGLVDSSLAHVPRSVCQITMGTTLIMEPDELRSNTEAEELRAGTTTGATVEEPEAVTTQYTGQLTVENRKDDKNPSSIQGNDAHFLPELAAGTSKDVEQRMSASQEHATPIQPPKRKRGRPRKHPLPESATSVSKDVAPESTACLPIKRRPGRPRKYPLKPGQADDAAGRIPALRLSNYMKKKTTGLAVISSKLMGAVCERLEHVMSRVGALADIPALLQVTQPADLKLSGWDDVDNLKSAGFQQMFTKYMHEFALILQENVKKHLQQPKWYLRKPLKERTQEYNRLFQSIALAFSSHGFNDSAKQKLRDEMRRSVESFVRLYKSHTKDNEPLQAFKVRTATELVDDWELKYWRYQVPGEAYHENVDTKAVLEGYKALMASGRHAEAAAVKQLVDVVQTKDPSTSTVGNNPVVSRGIDLVGKRVKFLVKGMRWFEGDVIHYSYCDFHHVVLFKNDHLRSISLSSTEVCPV